MTVMGPVIADPTTRILQPITAAERPVPPLVQQAFSLTGGSDEPRAHRLTDSITHRRPLYRP
jgi:hypothetical protein